MPSRSDITNETQGTCNVPSHRVLRFGSHHCSAATEEVAWQLALRSQALTYCLFSPRDDALAVTAPHVWRATIHRCRHRRS